MNNSLGTISNPEHPHRTAFEQIPELTWSQAERLKVGIFWRDDGFGLCYRNDALAHKLTSKEVEAWLDGFDCGVDDAEIPDDLLAQLVVAEQVIMAMAAQMTDEQKSAAMESTSAAGLPDDTGTRRRAAIAAARKAGGA
jgi:hypothetical protein